MSYIGGKYRQSKGISSFIPDYIDNYVEVFGGAMGVYVNGNHGRYDKVVYNDVNPFMSNLFSCCTLYKEFIPLLEGVEPQQRSVFDSYKDEILKRFEDEDIKLYDLDLARKYVYVATQVFSGIINKKSKMVDLKGKYKPKYLSFLDRLKKKEIQKKLEKLTVTNKSYDEVIPEYDNENTLLYLDPPYYGTENLYDFHSFTKEHHEHLINLLKESKSKGILSYYEFELLTKGFPKDEGHWEEKDYKKASMASEGKKQSTGTEVLIMNF